MRQLALTQPAGGIKSLLSCAGSTAVPKFLFPPTAPYYPYFSEMQPHLAWHLDTQLLHIKQYNIDLHRAGYSMHNHLARMAASRLIRLLQLLIFTAYTLRIQGLCV